jgi:hypothetical protein
MTINFKGNDKEINDHSSTAVSESFNHTVKDDILERKIIGLFLIKRRIG